MNTEKEYDSLLVYPYRRPGQRTNSWAVAVDDCPDGVVYRSNSQATALRWAERHCVDVRLVK